jgi:DNA-binding CsgD family transcriptional regulator
MIQNKLFSQSRKVVILSVFAAFAATESPMTDDPPSSMPAPAVRAQRRARRETRIARRERYFNLMASGYSCSQIAKMLQTSAATVRREVDRALAERRLEAPERFAQVQVARLVKALRLAEAAIELGELKAVATYLRVIAALDRYHELASGNPPPRRLNEAPPLALPAPPQALTFAAEPVDGKPSTVDHTTPDTEEVASGATDDIPQ